MSEKGRDRERNAAPGRRGQRRARGDHRERTQADAGPRPLSARQHSLQAHPGRRGTELALTGTSAAVHSRVRNTVWARNAESGARRNRRRPDYLRIALRLSLLTLLIECAVVLLFSPHLWVRTLAIEGLATLPAERIVARVSLRSRTNIVALPTGQIRAAVEEDPVVERAEVRRRLPGHLTVHIWERQPWAALQTSRGGLWYTIDQNLVPFRAGKTPERSLPRILLDAADPAGPPRLGKRLFTSETRSASKCLNWVLRRPDFPLDKIVVDRTGKLCLNRRGGVEVRLGSGIDLDKKLNALGLLLERHADLGDGNVAYVNLYAFDAPAILPRSGPVTVPE